MCAACGDRHHAYNCAKADPLTYQCNPQGPEMLKIPDMAKGNRIMPMG